MTEEFNVEYLKSALRLACILDDLKKRIRTGWLIWKVRSKRLESVSEHCHSCLILANLFYPIYPGHEQIDLAKVNSMLIFHEIGEAVIGDVSAIDKKRHINKADDEHKAWRKLLKGLPYEHEVYDLLLEFDEHKTPEARFAYFIDKFDATKTMKRYYDAKKFHRLAWCIKNNSIIRNNDDIQRLVKEGAKNAADIWFADIYAPYDGDKFFLEAHRILHEMDTNIDPPTI